MTSARLGEFELLELIAEGGMGEVWRGVHVRQGIPVAVKILTDAPTRDASVKTALEEEVRAVASLHHPNIVMVLDYGTIGHNIDRFPEGTPYLVMEMASGGTLGQVQKVRSFADLRTLILIILDGLSHAHARGVIHRDLTPSNILIANAADPRPGLKIADFGLAFTAHRNTTRSTDLTDGALVGTVDYMAPEQLQARWRDYGPWTDLYAVGVIAFGLATGKSLWPAKDPQAVLAARVKDERVPFESTFEVPAEFEPWLQRMLSWEASQRFQGAADAAYHLLKTSDTQDIPALNSTADLQKVLQCYAPTGAAIDFDLEPNWSSADRTSSVVALSGVLDLDTLETDVAPGTDWVGEGPPMPATWRRPRSARPLMLIGAGLGLYAVRPPPFVGRQRERDVLWGALRRVNRHGKCQTVVIRGPTGIGKSRLARWISERAQEVGTATMFRARHRPALGKRDGLGAMLKRHFRTQGLSADELTERIDQLVPRAGQDGLRLKTLLCRLMQPSGPETSDLTPSPELFEALRQYFEDVGKRRPVLVWIDDAQWAGTGLAFLQYVMRTSQPTRVLFVVTVQDEALLERPIEGLMLQEIQAMTDASTMALEPLEPEDHRGLVEGLLPLHERLVDQVVRRTGGNPLFAVQLLGDWVQRKVLESTPHGFRLIPGEPGLIPLRLSEVWINRIRRVIAHHGPHAKTALELAAVLGLSVDTSEWKMLCGQANLSLSEHELVPLVQSLEDHNLALVTESGFTFAHGMIRESLLREADEKKQLESYQRTAAQTLQILYPRPTSLQEERLAHHAMAAQDVELALPRWTRAARARLQAGHLDRTLAIIDEWRTGLRIGQTPREDERWSEGMLIEAQALCSLGRYQAARATAQELLEASQNHDWAAGIPEAEFLLGELMTAHGNFAVAQGHFETALEAFKDDDAGRARCLREIGHAVLERGAINPAQGLLDRARSTLGPLRLPIESAKSLERLGRLARKRMDWDDAERSFSEATDMFRRYNHRLGWVRSSWGLGEIARWASDLPTAEARYKEAMEAATTMEAHGTMLSLRIAHAKTTLARRGYEQAYYYAHECLSLAERLGQQVELVSALLIMLPKLALQSDWESFRTYGDRLMGLLKETSYIDIDIAWAAELSADLCTEAEAHDDANRLFELATHQWQTMGHIERVDAIDVKRKLTRPST